MPKKEQSEKAVAVEPVSTVSPPMEHAPTQQPQPQPFNVEEIKKNIPKAFHGYIEPIMQWAQSVEARFKAIETEFPNTVKTKMAEAIEEARAKAQSTSVQSQAAAGERSQGGGGTPQGMSELVGMVSKVLGEGGSPAPNPLQVKAMELMNTLLDRAIASVTQKSSFERYFEEEVAKAKAKAMAAQVLS